MRRMRKFSCIQYIELIGISRTHFPYSLLLNGEHTLMVPLPLAVKTLNFWMSETTNEGMPSIMANTQMITAVKTVKGFV